MVHTTRYSRIYANTLWEESTSYYMRILIIVYFVNKYVECVGLCTEESMQRAVDQVKTVTSYSTEGEVS